MFKNRFIKIVKCDDLNISNFTVHLLLRKLKNFVFMIFDVYFLIKVS